MVRQVERLCPKLHPFLLGYLEILENREVHGDGSGLTVDVAASVAPVARRGVPERRRIEPLLAMAASGRLQRDTGNQVRTRVAAGVGEVRPGRDGIRVPRAERLD